METVLPRPFYHATNSLITINTKKIGFIEMDMKIQSVNNILYFPRSQPMSNEVKSTLFLEKKVEFQFNAYTFARSSNYYFQVVKIVFRFRNIKF
jgi:hypothetical protein